MLHYYSTAMKKIICGTFAVLYSHIGFSADPVVQFENKGTLSGLKQPSGLYSFGPKGLEVPADNKVCVITYEMMREMGVSAIEMRNLVYRDDDRVYAIECSPLEGDLYLATRIRRI